MLHRITDGDSGEKRIPTKTTKPKGAIVPPGTWFYSLLLVFMVPSWMPWIAGALRFHRLASLASPGCGKCSRRKNAMNAVGWRNLPKLLMRKEFWSRDKFGWIWSRNQTAITS